MGKKCNNYTKVTDVNGTKDDKQSVEGSSGIRLKFSISAILDLHSSSSSSSTSSSSSGRVLDHLFHLWGQRNQLEVFLWELSGVQCKLYLWYELHENQNKHCMVSMDTLARIKVSPPPLQRTRR